MNGHHGRSADVKFAALNAEGNLDSAERSTAKLKSGQINKRGGGGKYKCYSVAEAGGIFSVNRGRIFQRSQSRLKKTDSREKADFKQRPFPGIIKS